MSKHPRTEKARDDALKMFQSKIPTQGFNCGLSYYTVGELDSLCRQLETELNKAKASIKDLLEICTTKNRTLTERIEILDNAKKILTQ